MKIPVVYLNCNPTSPNKDYWDMALVSDLLQNKVWLPFQAYDFEETTVHEAVLLGGAVLVIPARHNVDYVDQIQDLISLLGWCVVILCGDEERLFDYKKLKHPRMRLWLMQPTPEDEADFYLGSGYPPQARELMGRIKYVEKTLDWFFSGQINHQRRQVAANIMTRMLLRDDMKAKLNLTDGFTRGLDHHTYFQHMADSKAVPAPSGIESPDSFRVFEALEAGAVPIADEISRRYPTSGYWHKVFDNEDVPFKIINDMLSLEGYIADVQRDYPRLNNKVFAWWQKYKRKMAYVLADHIGEVSGIRPRTDQHIRDMVTVLILTSPIKGHPSTDIIEQTINDIRKVLPDCEIIIGIDGIRAEQEHYRESYELYQQRLLWLCNYKWHNVLPVRFEDHMHQAAMTRQLLKLVKTPTLLFVEHDTALCTDFEYDWHNLVKTIEDGTAHTIRFHFEKAIPDEHNYLMIGEVEEHNGLPLLRTAQWSQRPHLSSTAFYRDMMDRYFTDDSRTMIEDKVHGYPMEAWKIDGLLGWNLWRLWIYHPTDGNIKRSYTTDGRQDDPKFEMRF